MPLVTGPDVRVEMMSSGGTATFATGTPDANNGNDFATSTAFVGAVMHAWDSATSKVVMLRMAKNFTDGGGGGTAIVVGAAFRNSAETGFSIPTLDANDNLKIVGDVAHDAADSGNPLKMGAKALAYGTNPTGATANDRTQLYANRAGILHVLGGHPNIITHRVNYTGAQTDAAIITVSAGTKIAVTSILVTADNANTVDVAVIIGFAVATTPTAAGVLIGHPGIAPGSGVARGNGAGVIGVGADDEDIRITSEVPTSGSITIVISYFTVES